jgi:hypothetical protein
MAAQRSYFRVNRRTYLPRFGVRLPSGTVPPGGVEPAQGQSVTKPNILNRLKPIQVSRSGVASAELSGSMLVLRRHVTELRKPAVPGAWSVSALGEFLARTGVGRAACGLGGLPLSFGGPGEDIEDGLGL